VTAVSTAAASTAASDAELLVRSVQLPWLPQPRGPAAMVMADLLWEHPQLVSQLSATWDAIVRHLGPSPTERLLHAVGELLHLCLAQPPCTSAVPPAVSAALQTLDWAFGLHAPTPMDDDGIDGAVPTALQADLVAALFTTPPTSLPELTAALSAWYRRLETIVEAPNARAASQRLETRCAALVRLQHPLLEVPAQYGDKRWPALDQHHLIERFDARVAVHVDAVTGEMTRVITMRADDGSAHAFALRAAPPLRPQAPLALERIGQLAQLLTAQLLKAREARRRALLVHVPANVRLGEGLSLAADGNMSRISLAGALAALRADGTQSAHATAIAHQRALARAPAHEDAATRKLRLREAFNEAVAATPESVLSRLLHGCAPSAGVQWELQRRITSQLGLHALLTHALQLRTLTPETIILRRDAGAAELLEFALVAPTAAHEAASAPSVPFRLTRALQQFITPLGIDGPFSGAFCAAAECFANHSKCPLSQWLDALARSEHGGGGRDSATSAAGAAAAADLVPWGVSGAQAAERMQQLSPALLTRAAPSKGPSADVHTDVHANVRALVEAATNPDALSAMPSAFQAWL